MNQGRRGHARGCAAIAAAGALLGVAVQCLHPTPAGACGWRSKQTRLNEDLEKLGAAKAAERSAIPGMATLADVHRAPDSTLRIDARPAVLFRLGHIPGAISLPADAFAAHYPEVQERLNAASALIVYCTGPSCEDASRVSDALRRLGHTSVLIFKGGWQEWTSSGLPEENVR